MLISLIVPENITPYIGIPGFIFLLGAMISRFFFWKCPSCETVLPLSGSLDLEYCPYCGEEIS